MRQRKSLFASAKNSFPVVHALMGIGLFGFALTAAQVRPISASGTGASSIFPEDASGPPAMLAQVPEPAPLLLLGGGLVCVGLLRKSRRSKGGD
jgi:hypothetical protein